MKTKNQALTAPRQGILNEFRTQLACKSVTLSTLLGCDLTRLAALGFAAFPLLLMAACLCDAAGAPSGWTVLLLVAAVHAVLPGIRQFAREGGAA